MAKALLKLGLTQDLVNRDLIRSILDTDDNGMPHNEYVSFWESLAKPATATHFLIELVTRLIDTERQFVKLLKKGIDVERRVHALVNTIHFIHLFFAIQSESPLLKKALRNWEIHRTANPNTSSPATEIMRQLEAAALAAEAEAEVAAADDGRGGAVDGARLFTALDAHVQDHSGTRLMGRPDRGISLLASQLIASSGGGGTATAFRFDHDRYGVDSIGGPDLVQLSVVECACVSPRQPLYSPSVNGGGFGVGINASSTGGKRASVEGEDDADLSSAAENEVLRAALATSSDLQRGGLELNCLADFPFHFPYLQAQLMLSPLPKEVLASVLRVLHKLPSQLRISPAVAESTMLALAHILRELLTLHPCLDSEFAQAAAEQVLMPFTCWPRPCGAAAESTLRALMEEVSSPGSSMRRRQLALRPLLAGKWHIHGRRIALSRASRAGSAAAPLAQSSAAGAGGAGGSAAAAHTPSGGDDEGGDEGNNNGDDGQLLAWQRTQRRCAVFADTSTTHAHNRYTLYTHLLRGTELSKLRERDAAAVIAETAEASMRASERVNISVPAAASPAEASGAACTFEVDRAELRAARQRLLLITLQSNFALGWGGDRAAARKSLDDALAAASDTALRNWCYEAVAAAESARVRDRPDCDRVRHQRLFAILRDISSEVAASSQKLNETLFNLADEVYECASDTEEAIDDQRGQSFDAKLLGSELVTSQEIAAAAAAVTSETLEEGDEEEEEGEDEAKQSKDAETPEEADARHERARKAQLAIDDLCRLNVVGAAASELELGFVPLDVDSQLPQSADPSRTNMVLSPMAAARAASAAHSIASNGGGGDVFYLREESDFKELLALARAAAAAEVIENSSSRAGGASSKDTGLSSVSSQQVGAGMSQRELRAQVLLRAEDKRPLLRLCVLGSNRVLRRLLRAYVALATEQSSLLSALQVRIFVVPLGSRWGEAASAAANAVAAKSRAKSKTRGKGTTSSLPLGGLGQGQELPPGGFGVSGYGYDKEENDIARFLAQRDDWYRRQLFSPFAMQPLLKPLLIEGTVFREAEALGTSGSATLPTSLLPVLLNSYMQGACEQVGIRVYRMEGWRASPFDLERAKSAQLHDELEDGHRAAQAPRKYTLAGRPDVVVPFALRVELGVSVGLQQYSQQKQRDTRAAMAQRGGTHAAQAAADAASLLSWRSVLADKSFRQLRATEDLEVFLRGPPPAGAPQTQSPEARLDPTPYTILSFNNVPNGAPPTASAKTDESTPDAMTDCRPAAEASPLEPWLTMSALPERAGRAALDRLKGATSRRRRNAGALLSRSVFQQAVAPDLEQRRIVEARVKSVHAARPFDVMVDGELMGPFSQVRISAVYCTQCKSDQLRFPVQTFFPVAEQ